MDIQQEAFDAILHEISSDHSLKEKQSGRSLTFGIINRRNTGADYSRNNWLRGSLYAKLLEFGEKYVTVPFDTVSVSFGGTNQFHKLKNSKGLSFVTATGNYTGGEMTVGGDVSGNISLFHRGFTADLSKAQFKLNDFTGERIVLMYYKFYCKKHRDLPKWDLRQEKGEWIFYRGETKMGKDGKKVKANRYEGKLSIVRGEIEVSWD